MNISFTVVQIALVIWASYNIGKSVQRNRDKRNKDNGNKEA